VVLIAALWVSPLGLWASFGSVRWYSVLALTLLVGGAIGVCLALLDDGSRQ
jgi:hypothetical protein